jgi:hypothetical protein
MGYVVVGFAGVEMMVVLGRVVNVMLAGSAGYDDVIGGQIFLILYRQFTTEMGWLTARCRLLCNTAKAPIYV